jgi:PAS domain S-box-containing protein
MRSALLVIAILAFLSSPSLGRSAEWKRALLIVSYHPSFSTTDDLLGGVKGVFDPAGVSLDVEFMDSKRFFDDANMSRFKESLTYKLSKLARYDVVLCSDDNALHFLEAHYKELFPGIPIVFCGVNNYDYALGMDQQSHITGVIEAISIAETLDLARQLQPALKRVIAIADNSPTGEGHLKNFLGVSQTYNELTLEHFSLKDHSFSDLESTLGAFSYPEDAILLLTAYKDKNVEVKNITQALGWLNENASVPVYHPWKSGPGQGALGGKVIHHADQGRTAAEIALRILNGENPAEFKVITQSPNRLVVDWNKLREFSIPQSRLPHGIRILNQPKSAYTEYREQILTVALIIVILCGIIAFLLMTIKRRKQAELLLRESEENLSITLNSIGDAVIATDANGRVTKINPVAERLTGWRAEDAEGERLETVFHIINALSGKIVESPFQKVMNTGLIVGLANHTVLVAKDKSECQIADSGAPIKDTHGKIIGVVLVFRDVTEEYELREQLVQSQKMEAIGQLAGGVAHDFNNMLGGIIASADMLSLELSDGSEQMDLCEGIIKTSERAAELTGQLLTFSRKGTLHLQNVDFHEIIRQTKSILTRSMDKRITIEVSDLNASEFMVYGDAGQLESIILNLAINARDAMKRIGDIRIATRNVEISQVDCDASTFELHPGKFVSVTVTDTGEGMSGDVLSHIFEPFFTTKELGKGTGLGLAAVYGAVTRHQGSITVSSEEGIGTEFEILMPVAVDQDTPLEHLSSEVVHSGSGTILLVDDEDIIRITVSKILESMGYDVLTAENGEAAIERFKESQSEIRVVLLDLIMPAMDGEECFHVLKRIDPDVNVIISSGYSRDIAVKELQDEGVAGFIKKPYRSRELGDILGGVLG